MCVSMNVAVTGTTGGIGGAVAKALAAAGHRVIAINRPEWRIIAEGGGKGMFAGPLDAVVFASGFCPVTSLVKMSDEAFMEAISVNCGLFLSLMRLIVKERLYAKGGMRAVAVSSVSAREGWAGGAAYCASKGALSAMCRALDKELSPRGISVAALEPGHVRTRMFEKCAMRMGADASSALAPEELANEICGLLSASEAR